jgi:predicted NAD/FAD-binding protein
LSGHGVTLLEAGFGGHANTVDMTLNGVSQGVDTAFWSSITAPIRC